MTTGMVPRMAQSTRMEPWRRRVTIDGELINEVNPQA